MNAFGLDLTGLDPAAVDPGGRVIGGADQQDAALERIARTAGSRWSASTTGWHLSIRSRRVSTTARPWHAG